MKNLILAFLALIIATRIASAQNTPPPAVPANDTAAFPYWITMMQDPSVNFYKVRRAFNLYWENRPIKKGCGWKPFKRWEYMMESRILPDGTRPGADAVYNAVRNFNKSTLSTGGNWTSLGPAAIPAPGPSGYEGLGRINFVAFHPTDNNKIFIGSPSGGMWGRNALGEPPWINFTDQNPTLGVSAIIVDYANPATILIGTGDRDAGDAPGMGVFKSTDGGNTWTVSNTGMGNQTVGRMIQHPVNPQIMLAATSDGIYRSVNAGSSWTKSIGGNFKDIVFKPEDPNYVYAALGPDFYRSLDNGISFVKIATGLPAGQQRGVIAVTPANPSYVYFLVSGNDSGFHGLYRSTDSGTTFSTRSTSPNIMDYSCDGSGSGGQAWYDLALAADPVSANTIYAGGVDVWKSTDGGTTWAIRSHWWGDCGVAAVHADCHFLGFSPYNNKLYACDDGGVWVTDNGGTSWTDLTPGLTIGQIYKLGQAQQAKTHVINGFQDNGTYTLSPSGWLATGGGDGMECAIDYANDAYSYYTIYYGDIYRRLNNAMELHIAGNGVFGITESGDWVTPFILHRSQPETMFVGYKNIWRCKNVKVNMPLWTKLSDNLGGNNNSNLSVLEQSAANTNILYAARSDNRLFRSDNINDNNPIWTDLTTTLPASGLTPGSLATHPTNPDVVYMALGNNVYKSSNKGQSWTNISLNLPAIHISTIAYYRHDQEGLYVGTDAGVYYKNEGMTGWISFSQGLPLNGKITELEIYYDNDSVSADVIRASSFGRGLWSSDMYHSAPGADFTADRTLVPVGCGINFTDLSSGVPTSWTWTFPGGTPSTSHDINPAGIVYNTAGTYLVKLKIANEAGTDSITKNSYITVSGTLGPVTNFVSDKNVLCEGEIVHFTDETENCPGSWTWDYSPSTISYLNSTNASSQNPVVQFMQNGAYSVTLTTQNASGSNSLTKTEYILQGGFGLPFTEDFEAGLAQKHWSVLNPDGNKTWDTITIGGTAPGHLAAWMNFFNYGSFYARDQLVSAPVNLQGFSSAQLTFQHAYASRGTLRDSLLVDISSDCGSTWTRVLSEAQNGSTSVFVTHPPMLTGFFPKTSADWCGGGYGTDCYTVDLTPWTGMQDLKIRFESYNRMGNNLFLDNISITGIVGISDRDPSGNEIRIYPNPTTGIFTARIPKSFGNTRAEVYDIRGNFIIAADLPANGNGDMNKIDLTHHARGIYYIRFTSEHSTIVKKVILE